MISVNEVRKIYKYEYDKYFDKLTNKELKQITDNINKNMYQYISDEINYYLENR